ncbi:5'-nucleotidase C-terminal domain-containing protein [Sulfitobacter sp. F26169L]|uniref:bifunctional metallophosphatase/5'-nucleotidase n=1 Tax=Sulfitobacter sp. F26169L TaxID=2996015 RepID=UPI002260DAD7|nr:5'-nucleotidase C-terminal domain-containing protein [Sulfitobacter sp. F26169L]MCX7566696.1 5'-nucleotidase C-terminal domain-containing protein [Sulfitobacter sp. F26169L]
MAAKLTNISFDRQRPAARLRILVTTDLHGHLQPYDYIMDQRSRGGGLAGLSHLIAQARDEAKAAEIPVILLDNGDTFQGTPLASYLAQQKVTRDNPIIASLNHLKYDAIGIGNHDLDHGLPYLKAVAEALEMPVLNSNLSGIDVEPLKSDLILTVPLGPDAPTPLQVGLLSVLPAQSAAWYRHHLSSTATLQDPAQCVQTAADNLRAAGADLIVVLAHLGVGHVDGSDSDIQAAHALVKSSRIDALILGHTHRRLPSGEYIDRADVDLANSTVGGVPAIMAGHAGSDLGVMDLSFSHDPAQGWTVTEHECSLRQNGAEVPADPAIIAYASTAHNSVRNNLAQQVATITRDAHSYFSLAMPTQTQLLTARAQHRLIRQTLGASSCADLPLLATAPAHGAGGRDGIGNFIHIAKGPVLRRHIAGLTPFENHSVGIRINGTGLHNWLEHAALFFNTLRIGVDDQMLANDDVPAFQFDTIFGLTYLIDPTAPPYARISAIRYAGNAVTPEQEFILATSQFRTAGGGGYGPIAPEQIVATNATPLRDSMIAVLHRPEPEAWDQQPPWQFNLTGQTRAAFLTHPDAVNYLDDIASLHPRLTGTTEDGFLKISIAL